MVCQEFERVVMEQREYELPAINLHVYVPPPGQVLQGQLEALEEFRENKDRLEEEARERVAEIERLKREQEEVVYSLEKKSVLDRDK